MFFLQIERGKPKCAKYWPDLDKVDTFGGYRVRNVLETSNQDYTLRELMLGRPVETGSEERKIYHFHFQVWIE